MGDIALPIILVIVVVALGAGAFFFLKMKSSAADVGDVDALVADKKYAEAAAAAKGKKDFARAQELFLKAKNIPAAADMSLKLGHKKEAAELYLKGKRFEQAAALYDELGLSEQAAEARELKEADGKLLDLGVEDWEADLGYKAKKMQFDTLLKSEKDDIKYGKRQNISEETIAQGMALVEVLEKEEQYALILELFQDLGKEEEGITLIADQWNKPLVVAPLLEKKQLFEQASAMYYRGGGNEQAASALVRHALASDEPGAYYDRVNAYSPAVAEQFLVPLIEHYPLEESSVSFYYQYAANLLKQSRPEDALDVFEKIEAQMPDYRDVASWAEALRAGKADSLAPIEDEESISVTQDQLNALMQQVATATAQQMGAAARGEELSGVALMPQLFSGNQVVGLESAPVNVGTLFDLKVQEARQGHSVKHLTSFLNGKPCDLGNIEVYYRLGLKHLAMGDWNEAELAFQKVEETSPGYRDSAQRLLEIEQWKSSMGQQAKKLQTSDGEERYTLNGELGRGGMAVVYRGEDSVLGREVALKFISEEHSSTQMVKDLFESEAKSVARLNHPNIVTIFDYGFKDGRAFICMEFIAGKTLEHMMWEGSLTMLSAMQAVEQTLDALSYAHDRDIIHRDIKPANIMVDEYGRAKVMDFGLATSLGGEDAVAGGTPAYMPPEQIEGEHIDQRTDLYSVAATLYEMLTGQVAFADLDRTSPPVSLHELLPALPTTIADIVMKNLQVDPNLRSQSAREFMSPIKQLRAVLENHAASIGPQFDSGNRKSPAVSQTNSKTA